MLKALTDMTTPAGVFAAFNSLLTEEVVKLINGSFLFELSGKNADCWLLDLKTGTQLNSGVFQISGTQQLWCLSNSPPVKAPVAPPTKLQCTETQFPCTVQGVIYCSRDLNFANDSKTSFH